MTSWAALAAALTGTLARPGEPGYGYAGLRYLATDRAVLPEAVVRCADPDDVARVLTFARAWRMPVAARGGGHSYADHSATRGLLLDLRPLSTLELTGAAVTVGAGVDLGALATFVAGHGRMVPSGGCPTVGVVGVTLAGGFGLVGRRYGLTTDHLVAATVVLPDGRVVTADDTREPDLFWALRGAGAGNFGTGNFGAGGFGVVTAVTLRTHPAPPACSLYARWPVEHAATAIARWQDWAPDAPDGVTAELILVAPDDLAAPPTVELFGLATLDHAATVPLVDAFAAAVGAAPDEVDVRALDPLTAARYQAGLVDRTHEETWYPDPPFDRPGFQATRSEFFDRPLPPAAITEVVRRAGRGRTFVEHREVEFAPWRGAYGRVPPDATAFVHRGARFLVRHTVLTGASVTDERRRAARRWVDGSWTALRPWGSGRVYPGYADARLDGAAQAYHGTNLARLAQVKAAYDAG